MEICEEEAAVVRDIYTWYTKERLTMWRIAQRLNLSHVVIPWHRQTRANKNGNKKKRNAAPALWSVRTVHRILANETYKGDWAFGKYRTDYSARRILPNGDEYSGRRVENPRSEWVHVNVPAIIAPGIWKEAELLRTTNRQMSSRNGKSPFPLRGRIKCPCGRVLAGETHKRPYGVFRYYACPKHRNQAMGDSCPQPALPADHLERKAWDYLRGIMEDERRFEETLRRCVNNMARLLADKQMELELAREEIKEAEETIEGLSRLASKARGKALEALELQIEQATQRHEHALLKEKKILAQLDGCYDSVPKVEATLRFRHEVLRGLAEPTHANMLHAFGLLRVQVMARGKKCQVFCVIPGEPGMIEFPPSRNAPSRTGLLAGA